MASRVAVVAAGGTGGHMFPALALGCLLAVIAVPGSPVGAGFDLGGASPAAGLWARYAGAEPFLFCTF